MSEHNSPERQRQERAKLVNAFSRRAWQPSEQPQVGPRLLAAGIAVVVIAGAVFGIGALTTYDHKKAEEHARSLAVTTGENPFSPGSSSSNQQTLSPNGGASGMANPGSGPATPPGHTVAPGRDNALPQGPIGSNPAGREKVMTSPAVSTPQPLASAGSIGSAATRFPGLDRPVSKLAAMSAQQGGETAPHIPRASSPSPSPRPTRRPPSSAPSAPHRAIELPRGSRLTGASDLLLKNVMTGMCAEIVGDGSANGRVQQHACGGSADGNERWDLVVGQKGAGPGGADLFTIRSTKDGRCLDLPGYGSMEKAGVTEFDCRPGARDNQMWYLDKRAKAAFWIRNVAADGKCLDVSGLHGSGGPDANLTIYPCSLEEDHLWSFS